MAATTARRIEHARIGADYPETERNNNATALRVSDRDPVVMYLARAAAAPTISDIGDQTIAEDTGTAAAPFVVGDADTAASSLTLSGISSHPALVPTANIVFGGIRREPHRDRRTGTGPVRRTGDHHGDRERRRARGRRYVHGDRDCRRRPANHQRYRGPDDCGEHVHRAAALYHRRCGWSRNAEPVAASSDPTIVPAANLVIGGTSGNRTLTVTPAANQRGGPVTITVIVSDGTTSASDSFLLTVTGDNRAPTLTGLVDATVQESKTITQALTIGDDDTAADALTVTAASSNDALLPDAAAVVSATGTTRTLTLTPIAEQVGETLLTVTVSDGRLTTTQSARLVVTAAPPPDPPGGLIGAVSGNLVTFTWTAPATGATPTFYVLEGSPSSGATTFPVINTGSQDTQGTVSLPVGADYFRVRAGNRAGTSDPSNEAVVAVGALTPLPGPPTGMVAAVTGTEVTAQWAPNTIGSEPAAWQIEIGSVAGARDRGVFQAPPGVTLVASTLDAGEYWLRVRGVNAAGEGRPSNEVQLRVGALPACVMPEAPVLLPATIVDRLVALTWRGSRNAAVANYRVIVGSQPGASDLAVFDVGPVNAFGAVAPPRHYFVTVVAMNDCGASQPSNTISVDVGPGPPTPTNLRAVVDGGRVTLAWAAPAGVEGYVLEAGSGPGLSDLASIPIDARSYVANGVPPGVYYVRVRAVGAGATSGPSGEIAVVVP